MKVLLVDPQPFSRDALRRAFSGAGDQVRGFSTVAEADRCLSDFDPDIVVAAVDTPDSEFGDFIERVRRGDPRRGLYALVEETRLEDGVAGMARGAHDFLWRPVSEARVAALRSRFEARRDRESGIEEMRLRLARTEIASTLPGRSELWKQALASLEREAPLEAPVLLTGESGTEKEPAARALHRLSRRGSEPFLAVADWSSVAALGASGGSVFVAEMEHAPMAVQASLRAEVERPLPRRLILSMDLDPREAAGSGSPCADLANSLLDHVVHLPPLRERGGDVELLARQFLHELDAAVSFEPEAIDALLAHDWPGNVRELKEVVRRAAHLTEGEAIGPTVVRSVLGRPLASRRSRRKKAPVVRIAVGDSLADVERRLIQKTLEFARGNKRKTAELLKLSLKTIYNKIKEYGLEH
ncbi:MAG TPA: helix-turn-helix domain-containing protein [Thermoanaerobaculia bacterium]|nr:helix-turn-helix domain-containing protein [Thermoanaerobaculia bacterium]